MKDMIFCGVFMICNLIFAYNAEGTVSLLNWIAYIVLSIYFGYLYSKEENNENK